MTTASGQARADYTTYQRDRSPAGRTVGADADPLRGGGSRVPRTRGALSGLMLMILGAWGALAPFVGPYFNFGFSPDQEWYWTSARGWLQVLPGAAAFLAGLLLLVTASRAVANLAAWLGILAGAWFIVGPTMQSWLNIGSPGSPLGESETKRMFETLAYFTGLGALILFFAATAFGRLSVRSVRDLRAARAREARAEAEAPAAYAAPAEHTAPEHDEVLMRDRGEMRDESGRDRRDMRDDSTRERGDMRDDVRDETTRDRGDMRDDVRDESTRDRGDMREDVRDESTRDRGDMREDVRDDVARDRGSDAGAAPQDEASMLDRDAGRVRRADEPPAGQYSSDSHEQPPAR